MKFDVNAIAKQVADRIVGKVDAMPHLMNKLDFSEIGDQHTAVCDELDFLLDGGLTIQKYKYLIEEVLETEDIKMAFEVANQMLEQYRAELEMQEQEMRQENRDYVRSVL